METKTKTEKKISATKKASATCQTSMTEIVCYPCRAQGTKKETLLRTSIPLTQGASKLHLQTVPLAVLILAKLPRKKLVRQAKIGEEGQNLHGQIVKIVQRMANVTERIERGLDQEYGILRGPDESRL